MPQTIVALATPTGRSGIGVIRLSGDGALDAVVKLTGKDRDAFLPRRAVLVELRDPTADAAIDKALITYFKAPHSFTGEDVVEISCHGSPVLLRQVIDLCLALGCRAAEPGEFTLRALAHGKLDLAEAEAIRDLIDAQTNAAARQAVRQLSGEMSRSLQPLKDELLNIIVVLESALEFVEDDLPASQSEEIARSLQEIADKTLEFADTYKAGHLIRDGLSATIVGRPNVGKSSLINSLVERKGLVRTGATPGVTKQINSFEARARDGAVFRLIDLPGYGYSKVSKAERAAWKNLIEHYLRTRVTLAALVLLVDVRRGVEEDDAELVRFVDETGTSQRHPVEVVIVATKIDKLGVAVRRAALATISKQVDRKVLGYSSETGEGRAELWRVLRKATFRGMNVPEVR